MNYTKSEKLKVLKEMPCEIKIKEYLNSLKHLGEDFACRSFIVKADIVESIRLFSTQEIDYSSEGVAICMIKRALLSCNRLDSILHIKELMLSNAPLKDVIDYIISDKDKIFEQAKNLFYLKDSNSMELFEALHKDPEGEDKILECISRLNSYIESKKENSQKKILFIKRGDFNSSTKKFQRTA